MKNRAKKLLSDIRMNHYHKVDKKLASNALENIKKTTGYELTPKQRRLCKEYAQEILGSQKYANWLYVYTAFNKEFREGWIPDNYFGEVVYPIVNHRIGNVADYKTLTNKLLNSDLIPDTAYKIGKIFYDADYNMIEYEDLHSYLFEQQEYKEYYVKLDVSGRGLGVHKVNSANFDLDMLLGLSNFVVQKPIQHHPWFEEIIPVGGTTIRLTTVRTPDNQIETRAAKLRTTIKKSSIVKFDESVMVMINLEDGSLGSIGADTDWNKYRKHPYSGVEFSGMLVPHFHSALKELEILHQKFIHFSVIGWDVLINTKGHPEIIEWNAAHPDIKYHEAFAGPVFTGLGWEELWRG